MSPRSVCLCALLACAGLLVACSHDLPAPDVALTAEGATAVPGTPESVPGTPESVPGTAPLPTSNAETVVAVLDLDVLAALEADGFGLASLVAGQEATTTREMASVAPLDSLLETLGDDLEGVAEANPKAAVSSYQGRRLFDADWLASDEMRFELTGVFNRLDRAPFEAETCGEVRFLYRLAYETTQGEAPMAGRLPMTVNVVFLVAPDEDGACRAVAQAWRRPGDAVDTDARLAWLTGPGPLSSAMRQRWSLKSVETSMQTIRWQSTVHPSMAGHVEYILRVFHRDGDTLVPSPLENTPDVETLADDPELRAELAGFLTRPESLDALDNGELVVPERFLATRALATSPRGMSRGANRPFGQLFTPDDEAFAGLDLSTRRTIGSPAALLRRLDGLTCQGCHQSHSVGGFHHLGRDRPDAPFGALLTGSSVHLTADLERRAAWVDALLSPDAAPDPYRPPAEHQGQGGVAGAPCGLGDPGFADWTCVEGLDCVELEDAEVGTCMARGAVGTACEVGRVKSRATPHRDRVRDLTEQTCDAGGCLVNEIGWAQGSCTAACEPGEPGCGEVLDIDGIQKCFRKGGSLAACEAESTWTTSLQPCDATTACRQDYVCVAQGDEGRCVPPYFVYQLRLDGYPLAH